MKFTPLLSLVALLGVTLSASAADLSLTNPEGTLRFTLNVQNGQASYRIDALTGQSVTEVIGTSPLGLIRTDAEFTRDLVLVDASATRPVEDRYELVADKQRLVQRHALERSYTLRNALGMTIGLTARAYADGIAFRYEFAGTSTQLRQITAETTGFQLPPAARIWAQPYSKVDTWAPGYEATYVNGIPAGTAAPGPEGWALPVVFNHDNIWGLVTESGLEPTFFGSHLEPAAPGALYTLRAPEASETYGVAPAAAFVTLPWSSPWRLVIVGHRAGALAESTLVTDVARPSTLADTSWIKPGVASWSWWSDMSSPSDYAKLVSFVDAAAHYHWRYSLADLGWPDMKGGDIKKLIDYAAGKNVGIIVWYNSGGKHNQVPDAGPRDLMADPVLREAELARVAALGVKGIKVDFMQSDKQYVIALYHDILRDAARHHLLVDFHGCTIPRGWERTYPNLISMEGVRGGEQYWDKEFAAQAHTLHTIYVFTRNAIGPMDYTPGVFTDPGASNPGLQRHLTTRAHELALLVLFQSGIQHVIDPAASLLSLPADLQEHLADLPAAWDETRVVAGAPGDLAVIARRSGKYWYLAGINGHDEGREIQVPLDFLGAGQYALSLITDGTAQNETTHRDGQVSATDSLTISLAGRGGFSARLRARDSIER